MELVSRMSSIIFHENAEACDGCVLKKGPGADAKVRRRSSKLNRNQIKRTIPLDMQNKTREQRKVTGGESKI